MLEHKTECNQCVGKYFPCSINHILLKNLKHIDAIYFTKKYGEFLESRQRKKSRNWVTAKVIEFLEPRGFTTRAVVAEKSSSHLLENTYARDAVIKSTRIKSTE